MIVWRRLILVGLLSLIQFDASSKAIAAHASQDLVLMPWPQTLQKEEGRLSLSSSIVFSFPQYHSARLQHNVDRLIEQWTQSEHAGLSSSQENKTLIQVRVKGKSPGHRLILQSDESYQLNINQEGIMLTAAQPLGAIRGMQTLSQLVQVSEQGVRTLPYVRIHDYPRFKWRGVLIDSARHFIPLDVIKRQIDGMAGAKMNVLHWHLTDDQGWRIESKAYPKLHQHGSDGLYYRQEEIRELVAYAHDRGIRVIPEIDMPGHASAIAAAYPELMSQPGSYEIERQWGIHKPTLNPIDERVYQFVDGLFKELTELFPDPYIHIGGDEVDPQQWNENEAIQSFIKQHQLNDHRGMQAYFNQRIEQLLKAYDKKMIGWDEVFHPDLSKDVVVQSWRGHDSLNQVVRTGGQGILSTGFYIDQAQPTDYHYRNDPNPVVASEFDRLRPGEGWQTWSFTMPRLRGSAVTGHFTLLKEGRNVRGFIDFSGRSRKALSEIELKNGELRFKVDTWMGVFSPVITFDGQRFSGYGVVANGHYELTGSLTASSDMKGAQLMSGIVNPALTSTQQNRILGAEATLWGENVVADLMDLRLWPRTYAIAERLWSARALNDAEWMYRRLSAISDWSEQIIGLQHNVQSQKGMQRLTKSGDIEPLMILAEAVEQAQYYHRHHTRALVNNYHQASQLDNFVDALPVENLTTRHLNQLVEHWLSDPTNASNEQAISRYFRRWLDNDADLKALISANPELSYLEPSIQNVMQVSTLGMALMDVIKEEKTMTQGMESNARKILVEAMQIRAETVVSAAYVVEKLLRYIVT